MIISNLSEVCFCIYWKLTPTTPCEGAFQVTETELLSLLSTCVAEFCQNNIFISVNFHKNLLQVVKMRVLTLNSA